MTNMTDNLELMRYLQLMAKYEEDKIKSRKRFEKDLFIVLGILTVACLAIMVSLFKIENYLEYIMKSLIAIEYK